MNEEQGHPIDQFCPFCCQITNQCFQIRNTLSPGNQQCRSKMAKVLSWNSHRGWKRKRTQPSSDNRRPSSGAGSWTWTSLSGRWPSRRSFAPTPSAASARCQGPASSKCWGRQMCLNQTVAQLVERLPKGSLVSLQIYWHEFKSQLLPKGVGQSYYQRHLLNMEISALFGKLEEKSLNRIELLCKAKPS